MANLYRALERGLQDHRRPDNAGAPANAAPAPAKAPVDVAPMRRFGFEMKTLTGRLQPLLDERKPLILAITASGDKEGSTTIAQELSYHLSGDGMRVLFCGLSRDMSRPGDGKGLPQRQADAHAEPTSHPNLSFVSTDFLSSPSSSAANNGVFRDWLKERATDYDVVIVDVPPLLQHHSWSGFMSLPDGVILVVEAEKTRSVVLRTTKEMIENSGGHVLCAVLNKRRHYIPKFLYKRL